jgi:hypothetical protein
MGTKILNTAVKIIFATFNCVFVCNTQYLRADEMVVPGAVVAREARCLNVLRVLHHTHQRIETIAVMSLDMTRLPKFCTLVS